MPKRDARQDPIPPESFARPRARRQGPPFGNPATLLFIHDHADQISGGCHKKMTKTKRIRSGALCGKGNEIKKKKTIFNLVQTIDRWTDTDGASEDQGRAIGGKSFTLT